MCATEVHFKGCFLKNFCTTLKCVSLSLNTALLGTRQNKFIMQHVLSGLPVWNFFYVCILSIDKTENFLGKNLNAEGNFMALISTHQSPKQRE